MTGWQGDEAPRADTGPIWAGATGTAPERPLSERVDASGHRPTTHAPPAPRARRRRRRWGWIAVTTLLVLALAGTAALATYLWRTTTAWQAEADRLAAIATDLRTERDAVAADLDQAGRDLAATDQQLREAQDRITALAEEKAQTADEREIARLLVGTAADVATQLETCVRGQDQLITALSNIQAYDPESVVQYAESVRAACTQALRGNEEIQRLVGTG
ncbi:MAG TPA: hypothetical protein VK894_03720 [Jiangellales bacterium]|nr:hypothetical protein [Jiangellales bacterium]